MSERIEMTVTMQVTVPQALALQAMFKHWNRLSAVGASRMIGFFADGDGNFHPRCTFSFSEEIPALTEELEKLAAASDDGRFTKNFDFDSIAWSLRG